MISIRVGFAITFKKDAALFNLDVCIAILQRKADCSNLLVTFVTQKNEMYHFHQGSRVRKFSTPTYEYYFLSSLALFLKYFLNKKLLCMAFKFSFKS
jgi:hypothetical protein